MRRTQPGGSLTLVNLNTCLNANRLLGLKMGVVGRDNEQAYEVKKSSSICWRL